MVAVGRTTHLTMALAVASTSQTVSVIVTQPAFDSSQTSPTVNIDRDRVEELPIPNGNYPTLVSKWRPIWKSCVLPLIHLLP
jgi:hypothetical protein